MDKKDNIIIPIQSNSKPAADGSAPDAGPQKVDVKASK